MVSIQGSIIYQLTYPHGVKSYSKTNIIKLEEFLPIKQWWNNRVENEVAWKVSIKTIIERGYDMDIKNPKSIRNETAETSSYYIEKLKDDISVIYNGIDEVINFIHLTENVEIKTIGEVCRVEKGKTGIKKAISGDYPLVTTSDERSKHNTFQFDNDAVCIPLVSSTGHGHASLKRLHFQSGKFALGSILAAVIPNDSNQVSAKYLYYYLNNFKNELIVPLMKGMANVSLSVEKIQSISVPIPKLEKQLELIYLMDKCNILKDTLNQSLEDADKMMKALLNEAFANN